LIRRLPWILLCELWFGCLVMANVAANHGKPLAAQSVVAIVLISQACGLTLALIWDWPS